jgi:hypothetical protein
MAMQCGRESRAITEAFLDEFDVDVQKAERHVSQGGATTFFVVLALDHGWLDVAEKLLAKKARIPRAKYYTERLMHKAIMAMQPCMGVYRKLFDALRAAGYKVDHVDTAWMLFLPVFPQWVLDYCDLQARDGFNGHLNTTLHFLAALDNCMRFDTTLAVRRLLSFRVRSEG